MKQYDIFISYRRVGTGDKAEHLKDLLDDHYKGRISFDRENLTGLFATQLIERIDSCKDFILVVGKDSFKFKTEDFGKDAVELYTYLGSCSQQEFEAKINELGPNAGLDFVRIEIARALNRKGLNIIPLAPQTTGDFSFSKLNLPDDIVGIKKYEAIFYSDNADALFKDVVPKLLPHMKSKKDIPAKGLILTVAVLLLIAGAGFGISRFVDARNQKKIQEQVSVAEAFVAEKGMGQAGQMWNYDPGISLSEIIAVNSILRDMVKIDGGTFMQGAAPNGDGSYDEDVYVELETPQTERSVNTFFMSQREVSFADWNGILGVKYDRNQAEWTKNEISFEECEEFIQALCDLTGLDFNIPTEAQWEYAARGGIHHSQTKYSGSDLPAEVAIYEANSNGEPSKAPISNSPTEPNALGLFNMSGNVSEWCSDIFSPYDPEIPALSSEDRVIRGGSFESPDYELTVYHRSPMSPSAKAASVGLRLVISR